MLSCLLLVIQIALPSYDLLDSVKSTSNHVTDLKDAYRVYRVNDIADECKQNINLSFALDGGIGVDAVLVRNIADCEAIKTTPIGNEQLKGFVRDYLEKAIQNFQIMKDKGSKSKDFETDIDSFRDYTIKYYDFLHEHFDKLVTLPEKKYWQIIDKKNYAKSKEYGKCVKPKQKKPVESIKKLDDLAANALDFQEQTIYQIGAADTYVKYDQQLGHDSISAYSVAISKYKSIIDQNKYCMYLYEAWVKWRSVVQRTKGLSHSSEIPNDLYNKERERVAAIILKQISDNEKDEMAVNQFFVVATHEPIKRFGQYEYGNQSTIEFHEFFDDKK